MKKVIKALIIIAVSSILICPFEVHASEDTYLSGEIQWLCEVYGAEYNICPELLMAMIEKESSGQQYAKNGSCKGLLQVSDKWHRKRMDECGVDDIYDKEDNILIACEYLSELFEKYEDVGVVLSIYHGESDIYSLSSYTSGILERSAELERLHGK